MFHSIYFSDCCELTCVNYFDEKLLIFLMCNFKVKHIFKIFDLVDCCDAMILSKLDLNCWLFIRRCSRNTLPWIDI